jgi:hypothetical protein
MSFDEIDLRFYDTSEWSDDTEDDDDNDLVMFQSDYEIDENYSLEESIDVPEDSILQIDNDRNFIFNILPDGNNSLDFSMLPELRQHSFINNQKCLKIELKGGNLIKLKSQASSNLVRINNNLLSPQMEVLTYIITQTNKNHFIINQTYSPLLYAVAINSSDLVYDLIVYLKCDPNLTHGCHLNFEKFSHSRGFKPITYQSISNIDELTKERLAIEKSEKISTEVHFYSPLMLAVKNNNYKICELLLSQDADVNCLYSNGKESCGYPSISSLSLSINKNNLDILKLLINYNANINERLWFFGTPYSHVFTFLSTAKKMSFELDSPNSVFDSLAELYDYLIRKHQLEVTNGDLYLIFQELAFLKYATSISNNVFMYKSVIVLLKFLSILSLKHIENSKVWLTRIISKIILLCYEKDNYEKLKEVLKYAKIGGLINIDEIKSLVFSEIVPFDKNNDEFMNKFLNEFKTEPLSLKQICRLKVKASVKYFTKNEIFKLPNLPNCLKNYLYYFDY